MNKGTYRIKIEKFQKRSNQKIITITRRNKELKVFNIGLTTGKQREQFYKILGKQKDEVFEKLKPVTAVILRIPQGTKREDELEKLLTKEFEPQSFKTNIRYIIRQKGKREKREEQERVNKKVVRKIYPKNE